MEREGAVAVRPVRGGSRRGSRHPVLEHGGWPRPERDRSEGRRSGSASDLLVEIGAPRVVDGRWVFEILREELFNEPGIEAEVQLGHLREILFDEAFASRPPCHLRVACERRTVVRSSHSANETQSEGG